MTPGRHAAADGSFRRSAGAAAGRGIVLLGVAVILGIVLLSATDAQPPGERVTAGRQTEEPSDDGVDSPTGVGDGAGEMNTVPTTTTTPPRQPREVKVLVVNASGVSRVAARVTDHLRPAGYNLLAPTNATPLVDESSVFFVPGFEREAAVLASTLPLPLPPAAVKPMPTPPPLPNTKGANVVVFVGRDLAAKVGSAQDTTSTTARARARSTTTTTASTSATSSTTSTTRQP